MMLKRSVKHPAVRGCGGIFVGACDVGVSGGDEEKIPLLKLRGFLDLPDGQGRKNLRICFDKPLVFRYNGTILQSGCCPVKRVGGHFVCADPCSANMLLYGAQTAQQAGEENISPSGCAGGVPGLLLYGRKPEIRFRGIKKKECMR